MWGRGSEADFQVLLAGLRADALCPPSCQRRKAALFFEAPPKPAGPRCSGVTVGTLDRVSSGRIWVSSGNWGTNTTSPQPRMAGLVHGDPMPWRGWQRQDLTPPGQTMPPVSAAYSPLLSPGSGDESPARVLSPQGKGGNRFCCVWTSAQQWGTTLELGLSPRKRGTLRLYRRLISHQSPTPILFLSVYLEEFRRLHLAALGSADHSISAMIL